MSIDWLLVPGTVSAVETFPTRCPTTLEKDDNVVVLNAVISATYFSVFIITNIVLRIAMRNEDQNNFQNFRLKSVTIGIIFVAAVLGVASMILLLPKPNFDLRVIYTIILIDIFGLLLYIIKEKTFTFPLILSLWNRFRNPNSVVPEPPMPLPFQELNARALENNISRQDCRIIDLEDDGGIFMGWFLRM